MTTPFWSNDPMILFNKDYIFELAPTSNMSFEKKLNALTRTIILLAILGFLITSQIRILFIGIVTLAILSSFIKQGNKRLLVQ
jgi:hypothetical protein